MADKEDARPCNVRIDNGKITVTIIKMVNGLEYKLEIEAKDIDLTINGKTFDVATFGGFTKGIGCPGV